MFNYDFSESLKKKIKQLAIKNPVLLKQLRKKVDEIINSDFDTINHYKNLRNNLSDRKRVHIGENFVLTFRVDLKSNYILFLDFDHRDNIYN